MSDDLIKRLEKVVEWAEEDFCSDAARDAIAALAEAQAEIARLRDQIGDWIVRADEANARADRMEAEVARLKAKELALHRFLETVPDGLVPAETIDKICGILYGRLELAPALTDKPDAGEGE